MKDKSEISNIWNAYRSNVIVEASRFKPVMATYIYFDNEGELYQRDPYKLIGDTKAANNLERQGIKWRRCRIATSDDITELSAGGYNEISGERVWYEVDDSFPRDHSYSVALSNK